MMFKAAPTPLAELLTRAVTIGAYAANASEPDIMGIACQTGSDRPVALPYFSARTAHMTFRLWREGDPLEMGPFNIRQPSANALNCEPDLLLMPLLGFDRQLNRLGQGGGHYDRYLAAHPKAFRVGVAWSIQEIDAVPVEATDQPLHAVLTENEWISRQ